MKTATIAFASALSICTIQSAAAQEAKSGVTDAQTPIERVCVADPDAPRKFPPVNGKTYDVVTESHRLDMGVAALDKSKIPKPRKFVYVVCSPIIPK